MESPEYNVKYKIFYPLLTLILYYLLFLMAIRSINYHFDIININIFMYVIILFFFMEAIIRYNAGLKLEIPVFLFIVEFGLFWLVIRFLPPGLKGVSLWLVWVLVIFCWFNIYDLCNTFNIFRKDCEKVYDNSEGKWSFDEFRRLLDYPKTWKEFSHKIWFINIFLFIIWLAFMGADLFIISTSIIFLLIEIVLLSLVYLDKMSLDWYIEGINRPQMITKNWYKSIIILLAIVLVFTVVLPYNYNPVPLEKIGRWLESILPDGRMEIEDMERIERPKSEGQRIQQPEQEQKAGLMQIIFFILQVLLGLTFVLLIMALIFYLLGMEIKKLANLPPFFKRFFIFFLDFIKNIFAGAKKIKMKFSKTRARIKTTNKSRQAINKEIKSIKDGVLPDNLRSLIFVIYNSMLKLFAVRGVEKKQYQTPFEFSQIARKHVKNANKEIDDITDIYVETAYSNHSLSEKTGKIIKILWEKVKKILL